MLKALKAIRWYVGELMGDTKYQKYIAHVQRHHPGAAVMTEREYWKAHYAAQDANPGARCC